MVRLWTPSSPESVFRNPSELIPAGPAGNQTAVYLTSFSKSSISVIPTFSACNRAAVEPERLLPSRAERRMRHLSLALPVQMNQIGGFFSQFLLGDLLINEVSA